VALQLVPIGVPGELYVGGAGLFRGYLNQPALTAERFIPHPFSTIPGEKIYRTGDKGRWLPDGDIEYLGRIDDQIKIRGYRIEPGEVEHVLLSCELISLAIVTTKQDANGSMQLLAYIVPAGTFDREKIMAWLKEKLPGYMIPVLIPMEHLPITVNGKINKAALPLPDPAEWHTGQYTAPRNETEREMAGILEAMLNVSDIGVHDNLFELGMHSLQVMRLVAAVNNQFGVQAPVKTFFQLVTVEALAKYITVSQTTMAISSKPRQTIKL